MARETIQSLKAQIAERDWTINQQTEMIIDLQRKLNRSEEEIRNAVRSDYERDLNDLKQKYDVMKGLYEREKESARKEAGEFRKTITALSDELEELKAAGSCVSGDSSEADLEGSVVATTRSNIRLYDHVDRRGRPALSDEARERIRVLRSYGWTIRKIASEIGLSYGSTQKVIAEEREKETMMEKQRDRLNDKLYDDRGDWIARYIERTDCTEDEAEKAWDDYYEEQMEDLEYKLEYESEDEDA